MLKINLVQIDLENHEKYIDRKLSKVDYSETEVAIVIGTIALRAFRDQKILPKSIPVIYAYVTDPVAEGVVSGISEPQKGLYTGISYYVDVEKRLQLVKGLFPAAKKLGIVYSTMPQSYNYVSKIEEALKRKEFSHLQLIKRRVGMEAEEHGIELMISKAEKQVNSIKDEVDVFLSPSDQMGIAPAYAQMVTRVARKPLIGIGISDVEATNGAVASIYPDPDHTSTYICDIVEGLMNNKPIQSFPPIVPNTKYKLNKETGKLFNIVDDNVTIPLN